jgi:hypothetical protein
VKKQVFICSFL